jgi:hypothetical protein
MAKKKKSGKAKSAPARRRAKRPAAFAADSAKMQAAAALLLTDKPHAVAAAIASQLTTEGRWPPNDLTKVMGTDFRYNQFTIANFLGAVRTHLAAGIPSFNFVVDGAFTIQALTMTVAALMIAVNARTT